MEHDVFDFREYKPYLKRRIEEKGQRGVISSLAKSVGCQTSYVSRVLNGSAHFSFEQAHDLNEFLSHSKSESHFFLLLVGKARSGKRSLKNYYQEQIENTLKERFDVARRVRAKREISIHDQMKKYSHWYYSAIHILVAIPSYQTPEAIARRLQMPLNKIKEALEFLRQLGLVELTQGRYKIGERKIHLRKNSPMLPKHHINWRLRAAHSIENGKPDALHFSSVIAISKSDSKRIQKVLLEAIEKSQKVIDQSGEESAHAICLDFFEV